MIRGKAIKGSRGKNDRQVPTSIICTPIQRHSQGITARGDTTAVTFGKGLPDREPAYLYGLIRKILTD
jgi:hypothetical protein